MVHCLAGAPRRPPNAALGRGESARVRRQFRARGVAQRHGGKDRPHPGPLAPGPFPAPVAAAAAYMTATLCLCT